MKDDGGPLLNGVGDDEKPSPILFGNDVLGVGVAKLNCCSGLESSFCLLAECTEGPENGKVAEELDHPSGGVGSGLVERLKKDWMEWFTCGMVAVDG